MFDPRERNYGLRPGEVNRHWDRREVVKAFFMGAPVLALSYVWWSDLGTKFEPQSWNESDIAELTNLSNRVAGHIEVDEGIPIDKYAFSRAILGLNYGMFGLDSTKRFVDSYFNTFSTTNIKQFSIGVMTPDEVAKVEKVAKDNNSNISAAEIDTAVIIEEKVTRHEYKTLHLHPKFLDAINNADSPEQKEEMAELLMSGTVFPEFFQSGMIFGDVVIGLAAFGLTSLALKGSIKANAEITDDQRHKTIFQGPMDRRGLFGRIPILVRNIADAAALSILVSGVLEYRNILLKFFDGAGTGNAAQIDKTTGGPDMSHNRHGYITDSQKYTDFVGQIITEHS